MNEKYYQIKEREQMKKALIQNLPLIQDKINEIGDHFLKRFYDYEKKVEKIENAIKTLENFFDKDIFEKEEVASE